MKFLFILFSLAFLNTAVFAGIPYNSETEARFAALEAGTSLATGSINATHIATSGVETTEILDGTILEADVSAPATNGLGLQRVARFVYNVATGTNGAVGAHGLGVTLPAKSLVDKTWFYTKTGITSTSNNGTLAFHCSSANDIFSAADIDGSVGAVGVFFAGIQTGIVVASTAFTTTHLFNTAACEVTATVATNAILTGLIVGFARYTVLE